MHKHHGFTLVEMSVVLAIIALVAGGIVAGSSLVHSAKLRDIAGEYQQYKSAANAFNIEYGALPGDLADATAYWGSKATCPADRYPINSPPEYSPTTCNGNEDGFVSHPVNHNNNAHETLLFWQHLSNAGMIDGKYSGRSMEGSFARRNHHPTFNCPNSAYDKHSCWGMVVLPADGIMDHADHGTYFPNEVGNKLMLGVTNLTMSTPHFPNAPVIPPVDMWRLDQKIDDGMPNLGMLRSAQDLTGCYNGTTFEYERQVETKECILVFDAD